MKKRTAKDAKKRQRGLLPRVDAKGDSAGGKRVIERLGVSPMSDCRHKEIKVSESSCVSPN